MRDERHDEEKGLSIQRIQGVESRSPGTQSRSLLERHARGSEEDELLPPCASTRIPLRVHHYELKGGISRTREFEKKLLALYAVADGTKCGNNCLYCSTGAVLRMHPSFAKFGEDPFGFGYAIVDPRTPERVARDACRKGSPGMVQLCATVDAWAPEARPHRLGRRCLEAILAQPEWKVRVLTKNAEVMGDSDVIGEHVDRVLVGLSITATPDKSDVMSVVEPNASTNIERMAALKEAHEKGFRTYGMLCPLLPGVADGPHQIEELVSFAVECGAEEVFVEPLNRRGRGLRLMQEALNENGYYAEAVAVGRIRKREYWSLYVVDLMRNVQHAVEKVYDMERLRFLLYPSLLLPEHVQRIRKDDAGVVWLR